MLDDVHDKPGRGEHDVEPEGRRLLRLFEVPGLFEGARRQQFNRPVQIVHVHADVSRFFSMKLTVDRCCLPNEIAWATRSQCEITTSEASTFASASCAIVSAESAPSNCLWMLSARLMQNAFIDSTSRSNLSVE